MCFCGALACPAWTTCRPSTAGKKAGERYECSERFGSGAARSLERDRRPAAGGADPGGGAAVLPLLRGRAVGERCADHPGRCAGADPAGVPVSCTGKAEKEKEEKTGRTESGQEAQAGDPAPQKGPADPEHPLHHPAGGGPADQSHHRVAAHHEDRRRAGRPG